MVNESIISGRRERVLVFSKNDDAVAFLESVQEDNLPLEFKKWVFSLLHAWELLDDQAQNLSDEIYTSKLQEVRLKLRDNIVTVDNLPGLEDIKEVTYAREEVENNPTFKMIEDVMGEKLVFKEYFEVNVFLTVVVRQNGQRQVLKQWKVDRPMIEIMNDRDVKPKIFPNYEIIQLRDSEVIVLINWIEGRSPETMEERNRCLEAAKELVKVKSVRPDQDMEVELDLNDGNFKITDEGNIFYIDQDLIKRFIKEGFAA